MTAGTPSRNARRRRWWTLWALLAVSALGIAAYAVPPYLTGNPDDSNVPIDPDVAWHYATLAVHAVPGGLALIIGPLQFVPRLRARRPRLHRIMGRIYMISVLAASAAAVVAAALTVGGLAVQVAFYILVVAWLYTLTRAFLHIRRGETKAHRIWMVRNYALTFAAVTLRTYLLVGLLMKKAFFPEMDFDELYTASVWASILGNVLVVEYFMLHRTASSPARRRAEGGSRRAEGGSRRAESGSRRADGGRSTIAKILGLG